MQSLELLFFLALFLYTFVIWAHKLRAEFRRWMIWTFGIALAADISGTVFLCMTASAQWKWNVHTITGFLSLLIMALHFVWALMAVTAGGRCERHFRRYSTYAWGLWLIAFVSGIIL